MTIAIILGIRSETIKMVPIFGSARKKEADHLVLHTGQQLLLPDEHYLLPSSWCFPAAWYDLEIIKPRRATGKIMAGVEWVSIDKTGRGSSAGGYQHSNGNKQRFGTNSIRD